MTCDELKNRISLALKVPILQQGFEIICKNLAELEHQLIHRKCMEKNYKRAIGVGDK